MTHTAESRRMLEAQHHAALQFIPAEAAAP